MNRIFGKVILIDSYNSISECSYTFEIYSSQLSFSFSSLDFEYSDNGEIEHMKNYHMQKKCHIKIRRNDKNKWM